MKIVIQPELLLRSKGSKDFSLNRGLALLQAIQESGNLRAACARLDISYRTGWDLLTEMERLLDGPVAQLTRGRGATLTELGQRLVWAQRMIHARFDPLLDSMAMEVESELQEAVTRIRNKLKIFASHGFAIAALNNHLQKTQIPVDFNYRGSLEAVSALSRGACDVAGFHVPLGALEPAVLNHFAPLLQPSQVAINLATRRQGLMVSRGNPKQIWALSDLFRPEVLFVNRQPGSGTRLILDLMLQQESRSGQEIAGFDSVELTHAAVAAYVASGRADVGMGVETAARQFDLDFIPLLTERYFLLCSEQTLANACFKEVLAYLQTSAFRAEISKLPGYDGAATGSVQRIAEAFPQLGAAT